MPRVREIVTEASQGGADVGLELLSTGGSRKTCYIWQPTVSFSFVLELKDRRYVFADELFPESCWAKIRSTNLQILQIGMEIVYWCR